MKLFKILSAFFSINIIRAISPFLLLPVLTSYLSTSDYGTLSLIEACILVLTPLAMLNSSGLVSTRYYKENHDYISRLNYNVILVIMLASVALAIFEIIAIPFLNISQIHSNTILYAIPVFILLRALNTFILNLWQTQHKVRLYATFSILILFTDLGLSILFVTHHGMGYIGRIFGTNISYLIFTSAGLYLIYQQRYISASFDKRILKDIIKYGTPLIPHAIGGVSLAVANRYIIAYYLDQHAVGIYSLAYQISSVMLLLGTSINQAWSVTLFKWLGDGVQKNSKTIIKTIKYLCCTIIIASTAIIIFKDLLFLILSNKNYEHAKPILPFMVIGFMFQSLYFIFVNFDFYEEKVKSIGSTTIITSIIGILISCILTANYGLNGAAIGYMLTMAFYFIIVFARVFKFNKTFQMVIKQ
ncbi:hypothetical protein DBR44_03895 [Aquitalea sp. FJL05]|uniref:lipopolysaccharide biosynthesis protein n=1 Tax=Aquitalea sp. FJL05 TaxID=2153366 RepID=UPI000F591504|nr:oligosaccharide flippase family protein [Aquitalea sp. FJL05]RQO76829.1 hypothetical protein DBR44_03895 [Aquitalea sp. FJL05]